MFKVIHVVQVTYQEGESSEGVFRSRVLCLPLYTVLLAGDAAHAHYLLLAGPHAPPALRHAPLERTRLQVLVRFATCHWPAI
jgi:hypothetical protein